MFQQAHAMLPSATHDEGARQDFCASLRKMFTTELFPGSRAIYTNKLLPEFERKHGRKPATQREARGSRGVAERVSPGAGPGHPKN